MELKQVGNCLAAYQRAGNDKNGTPIFLINIFERYSPGTAWHNQNYYLRTKHACKLDKNENIRAQSYNIDDTIKTIVSTLEK